MHAPPVARRLLTARRRGNTLLSAPGAPCNARRRLVEPLIEPLVPLPLWRNVPTNPELSLYAEVVFDAVRLVRGESGVMSNQPDVRAARHWISAGDIGSVTFNACCAWLGWDAEHTREAIFSTARPVSARGAAFCRRGRVRSYSTSTR
jgi:hypothetical protein